jgi:hypothetical protein
MKNAPVFYYLFTILPPTRKRPVHCPRGEFGSRAWRALRARHRPARQQAPELVETNSVLFCDPAEYSEIPLSEHPPRGTQFPLLLNAVALGPFFAHRLPPLLKPLIPTRRLRMVSAARQDKQYEVHAMSLPVF